MPTEYVAIVFGLLAGVMAVIPLWLAIRLSKRPGTWFSANVLTSGMIAQGINLAWMVAVVVVCILVAKEVLLWFTIPAVGIMVVLYLAIVVWLVVTGKRGMKW
ncbi:MAG: hypothetical protein LBU61_00370 [Coriobacteriales bacterium]|nr:hypothetical protein [Coriobacteriales bacterium]